MKSAKLFLMGMYLHLVLSAAVPAGIVYFGMGGWNTVAVGLLLFYLAMVAVVQITGWVCVGMASLAYRQNKVEPLRRGWQLLKLGSIPFYVLNFMLSLLVWFVLIAASRGIFLPLVLIPVFLTCLMIVQSGCVGICYLKHLRKQPEHLGKPGGIHYVLQLLAVLDVASTLVILRRYGKPSVSTE